MKITPMMIMASVLTASLAGGIVAAAVITDARTPTTSRQSRDHGSATRTDGIAGCFVEGVPLAVECLEHAPRCPYEDGDPSGWPCLWINPRTQLIYYVSSREYWD